MNADVDTLCGPRGKHNPERAGYRHGTEAGSVTLGGRRVPVQWPRVRARDGSAELPVPGFALFVPDRARRAGDGSDAAGLSTRRCGVGLEPGPPSGQCHVDVEAGGVAAVDDPATGGSAWPEAIAAAHSRLERGMARSRRRPGSTG
jgi:hypothetical protein